MASLCGPAGVNNWRRPASTPHRRMPLVRPTGSVLMRCAARARCGGLGGAAAVRLPLAGLPGGGRGRAHYRLAGPRAHGGIGWARGGGCHAAVACPGAGPAGCPCRPGHGVAECGGAYTRRTMFRWLLVILLALMFISWLSPLLRRLGFGRLPGDFRFRWLGRGWDVPLAAPPPLELRRKPPSPPSAGGVALWGPSFFVGPPAAPPAASAMPAGCCRPCLGCRRGSPAALLSAARPHRQSVTTPARPGRPGLAPPRTPWPPGSCRRAVA